MVAHHHALGTRRSVASALLPLSLPLVAAAPGCGRSDTYAVVSAGASSAGTTGDRTGGPGETSSSSTTTSATSTTSTTGADTGTTTGPLPPPDFPGPTSDSIGTTGNPPPPVACPGSDDRGSLLFDLREPAFVFDQVTVWRAVSASLGGDVVRVGRVDTGVVDAVVGGVTADGIPWFQDQYDGAAAEDDLASDVAHDTSEHAFVVGLETADGQGPGTSGAALFMLRYTPDGNREWAATLPPPEPGWRYDAPGVGVTDEGVTLAVARRFSVDGSVVEAIAVDDAGQEIDRRAWSPSGPDPWIVRAVAGSAGRVAVARNGGPPMNPTIRAIEVLVGNLSTLYVTELPEVPGAIRDVAISPYGQVAAVGGAEGDAGAWWLYRLDPLGTPAAITPDVSDLPLPFAVRAVTLDCEGNAVVSGEGTDGPWAASFDPSNEIRWAVSFGGDWAGRIDDHALDAMGDVTVLGRHIPEDELYVTRIAGG